MSECPTVTDESSAAFPSEPTAAWVLRRAAEMEADAARLRDYAQRRCPVVIDGRPGTYDGELGCIYTRDHKKPHRFMAPDSTLRWWPVELGEPPGWDGAIKTPATDPRWPDEGVA